MKTVLLFRHGKSDWYADYDWDHNRPLAKRGRKAARAMGRWLAETGPLPESIVSSSAKRAQQTLKRARKAGATGSLSPNPCTSPWPRGSKSVEASTATDSLYPATGRRRHSRRTSAVAASTIQNMVRALALELASIFAVISASSRSAASTLLLTTGAI